MSGAQIKPSIFYASVVSKNLKIYTFQSPLKQYFSFPFEVIKYIIKNPKSLEGLLKFNQTCKYFYLKQRILVIAGKFTWKALGGEYEFKNFHNLTNVLTPNLWLHEDIVIDKKFFFDFKKVYRSTIKCLVIYHAKITLQELELLLAEKTVEIFSILSFVAQIIDPINKKDVSIDAILQLLPNVRSFWYFIADEKYSKATLLKMTALKLNNKLETLTLYLNEVSADFDANLIFKFILKNAEQFCKIYLLAGEETTLSKLKAAKDKVKFVEKQKFWISNQLPFVPFE